ncbi:MAG: ELM1/GtrOC1 family putative glycosyltransferase [Candidatus Ratteibacteria bacterium]|nr:ELM1/GtrOC1 family putative glycosyltransferase [Candidatus Ratteibacteria bacterium]
MQKARPNLQILVLNDGFKGNLNQSLGIAQAFPSPNIKIFDVHIKGPSYHLPSRKGVYPLLCKLLSFLCVLRLWRYGKILLKYLLKEQDGLWNKRYDIVISAGSILSPVNLIISKNIKALSVNIMVPSVIPLKLFDFAIIPYHDFVRLKNRKLKNIIVTLGAPNCITDKMLESERKRLSAFITVPENKEVIGILIGGNDQNYRISVGWVDGLFKELDVLKERYSFILTTSRRTDSQVISFIQKRIEGDAAFIYAEFPGYSEYTCYPGILSLCDYVFVTEDSINMISEAATSGRPVLVLGVERKKKDKQLVFDKTLEKLIEKGYAEYLPVSNGMNTLVEKLKEIKNRKFNKLSEAEQCARKILKIIQ